jgi:hypothetical protein
VSRRRWATLPWALLLLLLRRRRDGGTALPLPGCLCRCWPDGRQRRLLRPRYACQHCKCRAEVLQAALEIVHLLLQRGQLQALLLLRPAAAAACAQGAAVAGLLQTRDLRLHSAQLFAHACRLGPRFPSLGF